MAYRPKGRSGYVFMARTPTGWRQMGAGSTSKKGADRIEGIWNTLATEHLAWDVLGEVLAGRRTLREVVALWEQARHQLPALRAAVFPSTAPDDPDVAALVDVWATRYRGQVKADTADHALQHVRTLLPEGTPRPASTITPQWLDEQLNAYPGKRNTRRKVHSSWSVFFEYLTTVREVFPVSPMAKVARPNEERGPIRFYEQEEAEAIVNAQPTPDRRAYMALVNGTGCDVTVALGLIRRDVWDAGKEVRAPGTKAYNRDRVIRVAEWAWPIVAEYVRHRLPTARLFPAEWTRHTVSDWHKETVVALVEQGLLRADYPLRNSRHHWAVRAMRAGTPAQVVASQLGHGGTQLVLNRYGRFQPSAADRDRWEVRTAQHEAERQAAAQAANA